MDITSIDADCSLVVVVVGIHTLHTQCACQNLPYRDRSSKHYIIGPSSMNPSPQCKIQTIFIEHTHCSSKRCMSRGLCPCLSNRPCACSVPVCQSSHSAATVRETPRQVTPCRPALPFLPGAAVPMRGTTPAHRSRRDKRSPTIIVGCCPFG